MSFKNYRRVLFTLFMSAFVIGFFHRFAPGVIAERIAHDFGLSATWLGVVGAAYFWTYTAMQIPAGVLIDRWGGRRVISAGLMIVSIGTALFSVAQEPLGLVAGRLLVGFGVSALFVGILRSHASWYASGEYTSIVGATMLIGNLGAMASAGPFAVLLEHYSWQSGMLLTAMLTAAISILTVIFARDHPEDLGFPSVVPSPNRSGDGYLAAISNALRQPGLYGCLLAGVGTNATFYSFAGLWGVPLLQDSFALSAVAASVYTTVALLLYGVASLFVGVAADRIGARRPFIVATGWLSSVAWAALVALDWSPGLWLLVVYSALGIAAAQMVVTFSTIKDMVPAPIAGLALAIANTCVFLGVAIIHPLVGWILDLHGHAGGTRGLAEYQSALSFCLGISIAAAVAAMFIPETLQRHEISLEHDKL